MQFYSLRCSDEEVQIWQEQLLEIIYRLWSHLCERVRDYHRSPVFFSHLSPIQVLLVTFFAIHMKRHLQRMCQGARSEPPWVTTSSLLRIDVNSDVSSAHVLTNPEVLVSATWWQRAQIPHKTIFHMRWATSLCSSEGLQSLPCWPHAFSERQGHCLWLCSCEVSGMLFFPHISAVYRRHDAVLRTGVS